MREISREVILEAQEDGIDQLFLENPLLFSEKLLEGRLKQFDEAKNHNGEFLFYDRGIPDVTAYMDYFGTKYPDHFDSNCIHYKYDAIFLLPPWEKIYVQDNERYESYAVAKKIYTYLLSGYQKYDYHVHEVTMGDVNDRVDYILEQINTIF